MSTQRPRTRKGVANRAARIVGIVVAMTFCLIAHASGDLEMIFFKAGRPTAKESITDSLSDTDSRQLDILEMNANILRNAPGVTVEIMGFADTHECSREGCYQLSLRRARSVYEWLISHGVPASQLKGPTGNGSDWPIDRSDTEEAHRYNRRVQFDFTSRD